MRFLRRIFGDRQGRRPAHVPDGLELHRLEPPTLDKALRDFRVELAPSGRGKHHAYHVTDDGVLLAVDAVDMYLACLAGLDEFWDVVAASGGGRGNPFAVSLDEIDLGDGKGDFTYVYNRCGEAFVDAGGPMPPPYAHDSARATADDFKNAVVHAQAEAAERERSCYANAFHRR